MTTTRSRLSACLHSLKQASVSIASHALLTFLIDYEELRKTRQQAAEAKAEAAKVADHLKSAAEAARLASALELTVPGRRWVNCP